MCTQEFVKGFAQAKGNYIYDLQLIHTQSDAGFVVFFRKTGKQVTDKNRQLVPQRSAFTYVWLNVWC